MLLVTFVCDFHDLKLAEYLHLSTLHRHPPITNLSQKSLRAATFLGDVTFNDRPQKHGSQNFQSKYKLANSLDQR